MTTTPEPLRIIGNLLALAVQLLIADNPDLLLQPGLRGFAKIDAGHSTLAWWLWRLVTKTFHFTL